MYPRKYILLTVIYSAFLLIPAMAVADSDPETFQADKDQHIANILERIQIDQKDLSCVQAAQDHEALKACRITIKEDRDTLETKVKAQTEDKKVQKGTKNKEK
ncbi:MAG: hypothetical protein Q8L79_11120 [Methylobacter sp.]|uniref:hypothetical protein n=1 Tax=Methylobacter sp. TaxID=2051955 RepID=UPI00273073C0|nr:hypothetical protein [Methylobacter sp.]MDP1665662.1 hypothetical protein [Methylobacter sp.]